MIHIVVRVLLVIVLVVELQKTKKQFQMFDDSQTVDENVSFCCRLSFIQKNK